MGIRSLLISMFKLMGSLFNQFEREIGGDW
jgi:hypothetical protein